MPQPNKHRERSYSGEMKQQGKIAEAMVLDFLKWHGGIDSNSIDDVRDNPEYQSQDIDFMVQMDTKIGSIRLPVEAKYDTYAGRTGNILFELIRIYLDYHPDSPSKGFIRQGWSWFSEAKRFCIWSPNLNQLYVIAAEDLRSGLQQYLKDTPGAKAKLGVIETDINTRTMNCYVPERYVSFHLFQKVATGWRYVRTNKATAIQEDTA